MAKYRKLSRTSSQRKALLRGQVTALIQNGKIVTTEAKAKEVRKIAEHVITLAVREKDNFETVKVKAKVARKDKDGKRVKEEKDGKRSIRYEGKAVDSFTDMRPGGGVFSVKSTDDGEIALVTVYDGDGKLKGVKAMMSYRF